MTFSSFDRLLIYWENEIKSMRIKKFFNEVCTRSSLKILNTCIDCADRPARQLPLTPPLA